MSIAIYNNASATKSLAPSIAIPSGASSPSSGDLLYVLVQANSSGDTCTPPTGWTQVGSTLGPGGGSNCQTWLFKRTADGTEGGATWTGTFAGGVTPAWAVLLLVGHTVSEDQAPVSFSDNTLDSTLSMSGITPSAANCTLTALAGITTVSAGGSFTVTPPAGWTEDADANDGFVSGSNVGVWAGHKVLSGQAGVAQTAPAATTTVTQRSNGWMIALAPIAVPTPSYTFTTVALTASVNGTASTAATPATVASYDWDWGDGSAHGSGSTASHTYTASGTYLVKLTVTDSNGLTNNLTQSVTVLAPAGTAGVHTVDVSTGWSASSGTVLSCVNDGDPTTFATSSANPTALEFDFTLEALTAPSTGQALQVFLTADSLAATSASLAAQLVEGSTTRSSLTGVSIPAGSGSSVSGLVTLTFPWTDVQNVTNWNALHVKLQVTAS